MKEVPATVKEVVFKSSEKAFIQFEGGVVIELSGRDYVLDAGALFIVPTPTGRSAAIVQAQKKRVVGKGDAITISGFPEGKELTFKPAAFGLDTLWQVTNASMPQAAREAAPVVPVPRP